MPERKRKFAVYDVFSSKRLAGNPLAVVFEPDGLDDAAMQAIAGEFNLSETVFIWPAAEQGAPRQRAHFHADARTALRRASDGRRGDRHHRGGRRRRRAVDLRARGEGRAGALRGVAAAPDGMFAEFDLPRLPEPVAFSGRPGGGGGVARPRSA